MISKRSGLIVAPWLLTLGVVAATPAQEVSRSAPRDLAATCAGCHGTNGVSVGGFRSLAGRPAEELSISMREFKAGNRPGTLMPQLAKGYTDEQIAQLADWFARQKAAP